MCLSFITLQGNIAAVKPKIDMKQKNTAALTLNILFLERAVFENKQVVLISFWEAHLELK